MEAWRLWIAWGHKWAVQLGNRARGCVYLYVGGRLREGYCPGIWPSPWVWPQDPEQHLGLCAVRLPSPWMAVCWPPKLVLLALPGTSHTICVVTLIEQPRSCPSERTWVPRVTQLVSGTSGLQTRCAWLPHLSALHSSLLPSRVSRWNKVQVTPFATWSDDSGWTVYWALGLSRCCAGCSNNS